mmetsp:Transcript_297/g.913  ORF Transcript_297/g.913 Transcript_297/m.913 type:complete len:208 (+) Transcript_297:1489-2112(+)
MSCCERSSADDMSPPSMAWAPTMPCSSASTLARSTLSRRDVPDGITSSSASESEPEPELAGNMGSSTSPASSSAMPSRQIGCLPSGRMRAEDCRMSRTCTRFSGLNSSRLSATMPAAICTMFCSNGWTLRTSPLALGRDLSKPSSSSAFCGTKNASTGDSHTADATSGLPVSMDRAPTMDPACRRSKIWSPAPSASSMSSRVDTPRA